MELSPLVIFVYNRLQHLRKTIEALKSNYYATETFLYIFSDGPKNDNDKYRVAHVREYIKKIDGFKNLEIISQEQNIGLANSVINGVTKVIEQHGRVIVLEDDIVTSPYYLSYMNKALNYYINHRNVFSITGFNHSPMTMKIPKYYKHDVFLNPRASSWGWGAWKDRWELVDWDVKDYLKLYMDDSFKISYNISGNDKFDMLRDQMNGKIDSWAIRWDLAHYKNNAGCVYPVISYLNNIGFDDTGVHCGQKKFFYFINELILAKKNSVFLKNITFDKKMIRNYARLYNKKFIDRLCLLLIILFSLSNKRIQSWQMLLT
jgi:hypothetical protein